MEAITLKQEAPRLGEACLEYSRLLVKLHELIRSGRGETDEAIELREEMDGPGDQLTDEELVFVKELSAALYQISGEEIAAPPLTGRPLVELTTDGFGPAPSAAAWRAILALLRTRPAALADVAVASLRAEAYQALGLPEAAARFRDYARRQDLERVAEVMAVSRHQVRGARRQRLKKRQRIYVRRSRAGAKKGHRPVPRG